LPIKNIMEDGLEQSDQEEIPRVFLKAGHDRRVVSGHPWAYSNELKMNEASRALPPGSLVVLCRTDGKPLGVGYFNPHTLIAFRMLEHDHRRTIDAAFIEQRLRNALRLREAFYEAPFYRLVHAEGDDLPGLVIDRYDEVVVVQVNTAGIERLTPDILEALDRVMAPRAVVLRRDSPVRATEAMEKSVDVVKGTVEDHVLIRDGELTFWADPIGGQKTGWYFDQHENRRAVASLGRGGEMIDIFCHSGGFAIAAAHAGATHAIAIDSSEPALALARRSAEASHVAPKCEFRRGDAFKELENLAATGRRFRLVVVDPPAFAKSRKDVTKALAGYRKLARSAAMVVEPGGYLFIASCSHNVDSAAFSAEVARGITRAGRRGQIVRQAGAGPDHPIHLHLPETAYLKSQIIHIV